MTTLNVVIQQYVSHSLLNMLFIGEEVRLLIIHDNKSLHPLGKCCFVPHASFKMADAIKKGRVAVDSLAQFPYIICFLMHKTYREKEISFFLHQIVYIMCVFHEMCKTTKI